MEEIKLISLDLDGTLLNSKKTISERNVEALQACAEKGIEIVPTTGRTVDGIPESIIWRIIKFWIEGCWIGGRRQSCWLSLIPIL